MPTGHLAQQCCLPPPLRPHSLHATHSYVSRSTHQSAVIARFQGKTCHGGLFPGHTLHMHPCVSPCWHPCGHMLQAVSPLIVESCPALPPFAPTHASPASRHCRHCRHSHKTHYSSSHFFQSPKVQTSSPNPKSKKSISARAPLRQFGLQSKVQIRSPNESKSPNQSALPPPDVLQVQRGLFGTLRTCWACASSQCWTYTGIGNVSLYSSVLGVPICISCHTGNYYATLYIATTPPPYVNVQLICPTLSPQG